jgi:hypothetical protein
VRAPRRPDVPRLISVKPRRKSSTFATDGTGVRDIRDAGRSGKKKVKEQPIARRAEEHAGRSCFRGSSKFKVQIPKLKVESWVTPNLRGRTCQPLPRGATPLFAQAAVAAKDAKCPPCVRADIDRRSRAASVSGRTRLAMRRTCLMSGRVRCVYAVVKERASIDRASRQNFAPKCVVVAAFDCGKWWWGKAKKKFSRRRGMFLCPSGAGEKEEKIPGAPRSGVGM